MPEEAVLDLMTISGGAIPELFKLELRKVLENIHDPNTDAEKVREIQVVVKIKPDDERHKLSINSQVKTKLAPRKSVDGQGYTGARNGEVVAVTYDPRQSDLFRDDEDSDIHPLPTKKEAPDA